MRRTAWRVEVVARAEGGLHIQEQYEEGKFRPNQVRQTCDIQQRNRFSEYRKKNWLIVVKFDQQTVQHGF